MASTDLQEGLRLEWEDFGSALGHRAGRDCAQHRAIEQVSERRSAAEAPVAQVLLGEVKEAPHGCCGEAALGM